jgi:hypothetical protein
MLIAAAALAFTIAAPPPMPPTIVHVMAAADIPATLVTRLLDEADAIWRGTGVTFLWQRPAHDASAARRAAASPFGPATLRLVIGDDAGVARDGGLALGWIVFEDQRPEQEIYVSYANARTLLRQSNGVVGHVDSMPQLHREILLARAMGRALAHEIGHYLSGTKTHSSRGLMTAVHTAAELFGQERQRFAIALAEQQRIVARMTSIYIAARG